MKQDRNKPCLCGSGKKYKKCCWRAEDYEHFMKKKKPEILVGYHNDVVVCVVSEVTGVNYTEIVRDSCKPFVYGDWLYINMFTKETGLIIYGPFKDKQEAMDSAIEATGAVEFKNHVIR